MTTVEIEDGLYFPEDFAKLPKNVVIIINKGKLVRVENEENRKNR